MSDSSSPQEKAIADDWDRLVEEAQALAQQVTEGKGTLSREDLDRWLQRLGRHADAFMRSPPFLASLKTRIDAISAMAPSTGGDASFSSLTTPASAGEAAIQEFEKSLHAHPAEVGSGRATVNDAAESSDAAYQRLFERVGNSRNPSMSSANGAPFEVVFKRGTLRLLRYRTSQRKTVEPILICYALVNRPYILDLQPDRSVVRRLLADGFDVYLIDWGVPDQGDSKLGLTDYIADRLRDVVAFVCDDAAAAKTHLLGYCMGGTMSVIYTALFPERIQSLILLAAPIDFSGKESLLNVWAQEKYFDVDRLIDAWGNCPGPFLQSCFQLVKPVQNFLAKYITFSQKMADSGFVDNFLAMEQWASDSIPVAGETFREYVKLLYQQNQLIRGEMKLGAQPVRLASIGCPILMLVAEHDHLVPPEATLALAPHVASRDVKSVSVNAGHIGLAVSSRAHRGLWPAATTWIRERSHEMT